MKSGPVENHTLKYPSYRRNRSGSSKTTVMSTSNIKLRYIYIGEKEGGSDSAEPESQLSPTGNEHSQGDRKKEKTEKAEASIKMVSQSKGLQVWAKRHEPEKQMLLLRTINKRLKLQRVIPSRQREIVYFRCQIEDSCSSLAKNSAFKLRAMREQE
ncbi:hypothetical protein UY3_14152 [Chelonia mydas]|uniref:Uncharacterized protein n=1 Tax=Chelonia mydas TaxID=8469 RepID=M7ATQ1_CHEMY|nr:hypothetical protein UY3_14152 [Chelonia mydas]